VSARQVRDASLLSLIASERSQFATDISLHFIFETLPSHPSNADFRSPWIGPPQLHDRYASVLAFQLQQEGTHIRQKRELLIATVEAYQSSRSKNAKRGAGQSPQQRKLQTQQIDRNILPSPSRDKGFRC
jgi:hypothetical protein